MNIIESSNGVVNKVSKPSSEDIAIYKNSFYFQYPRLSFFVCLITFFPFCLFLRSMIQNEEYIKSCPEQKRNLYSFLISALYTLMFFFIIAFIFMIASFSFTHNYGIVVSVLGTISAYIGYRFFAFLYRYHNKILFVKNPVTARVNGREVEN